MLEFNATFLVAMISFVIFIFIMNIILYKPVLNIIRRRDDYIQSNYDSTKDTEQKTLENIEMYNNKLSTAREEERQKSTEITEKIQNTSYETIQNVKNKAKIELEQKRKLLEQNINDVQNTVKSRVEGEISSAIVSKLFEKSINK